MIYLFNLQNIELSELTSSVESDNVNLPGTSTWNVPTQRITFSSDREDIDEIWTMNPNGSDLFRVTSHENDSHFIEPSFSPDGQWIVYSSDFELATPNLFAISIDSSDSIRITFDEQPYDGAPSWLYDGKWIVFESHLSSDDAPTEIWMIAVPELSE